MRVLYKLRRRMDALFRGGKKNKELNLEIEQHIELEIAELVADGMDPKEARELTLREFGNVEDLKEECRDSWGMRFLENLYRHLRLAGRQLSKNKGYTAIAVATLALGIGVNVAIFSMANAVLFQSLPFEEPQQLAHLTERNDQSDNVGISVPNFWDWRERQRSFSAIGIATNQSYNLIESDGPERILGVCASYGYLDALKISPILGETFTEENDIPGAEATVLLGERFWRDRYDASPSIIGESINLTGRLYRVVGVLPYDFNYGTADVWTSIGSLSREWWYSKRTARVVEGIGRLKPGVGIDQARLEMEKLAADLALEHPDANAGMSVRVRDLGELLLTGSQNTLYPLLGASGFLFLIACANIAIMQVMRSLGRRHEFGIRVSLGANRRQILGQLTVENLALGLVGGAAGVLVAYLSIEGMKLIFEYRIPRIDEVSIDGATLAYATAASVVSGLLFGIAPMRQALRLSPEHARSSATRTSESGLGRRWTALVVGEFALTCALLIGAGLMIRTTANIYQASPGFETDQRMVFTWSVEGPQYKYSDRMPMMERAYEALKEIPGVENVGFATPVPFMNRFGQRYVIEGQPIPEGSRARSAEIIWAHESYFDVMGIRLVKGRLFNQFDTRDTQKVAIVDVDFVKRNFPGEDPIGKRFRHTSSKPVEAKDWIRIVGVVEHVKYAGIQNETREQMYHPLRQEIQGVPSSFSFVIKTRYDSESIADAIRARMAEVNSGLPVLGLGSFDVKIGNSFARERLLMQLLAILAGLALLLASVGLYGIISYGVKQRTREFGIRVAMGAEPSSLSWLVVKSGIILSVTGIAIGLISASSLSRFLSGMLYGITEFDFATFGLVACVLLFIGLIACWIPARRATRMAPSMALQVE